MSSLRRPIVSIRTPASDSRRLRRIDEQKREPRGKTQTGHRGVTPVLREMREPGFLGVFLHGLPDLSKIPPDPDIIDVTPLDAIRVAPTVTRQFEAGQEQLEFLAVGARHRGDGEIVQEWWTD